MDLNFLYDGIKRRDIPQSENLLSKVATLLIHTRANRKGSIADPKFSSAGNRQGTLARTGWCRDLSHGST